jgi:predicted transcriptional regulator of viral defense system
MVIEKRIDINLVSRQNIDIMGMNKWHTSLPANEFDYAAIMWALKDYKRPRDKLSGLLYRGEIIRVKKGIYTLGSDLRQGMISREVLANLIYGPSYISQEYALSYYQIIPERVETVTSVTLHKTKSFVTPLGRFTYRHVKTPYYSMGHNSILLPDSRGILMASLEKAIADKVYFSTGLQSLSDMDDYLFSDLRIDREDFSRLDSDFYQELAAIEKKKSLRLLADLSRAHT